MVEGAGTGIAKQEYFSVEQLMVAGAELGKAGVVDLPSYRDFDLLKRLGDNQRKITGVYESILAVAKAKDLITPAGEWLLDNFYLIQANIRQVKLNLPMRFYRQLPTLSVQDGGRIPRTMAFAWLYSEHSHCEMTTERLTAMVNGYQRERALLIGELWAIPSILRFSLIEELRHLAIRLEGARSMRNLANQAADELAVADSATARSLILDKNTAHLAGDAFASQLLYRLRDVPTTTEQALIWIESGLEARNSDAEEVLVAEQNRLANENFQIANIVRSLRTIDDIDWTKWFTSVCLVDQRLREQSNFAELDFTSQNQYRTAIETLARQSQFTELEVTEAALGLSTASESDLSGSTSGGTHCMPDGHDVGHFFVGARLEELERALCIKRPLLERLKRAYKALGTGCIAAPIIGLTLLVLISTVLILGAASVPLWQAFLLALLAALPASEAAVGMFNFAVTLVNQPSRLIGFEFKQGVPEAEKTLVVVPCMISSRDEVDELLRNLEVHYLSNPKGMIYFALASDWPDSQVQVSPQDEEILTYAQAEVDELSARYAFDGKTRFFLLHRRRLFNEAESCWMGWERKRGKLIELNRLLRGDNDTSYMAPSVTLPKGVRYVMTLDADTRLTRDAVTKLVGKLAHPLNAPRLDPVNGRVSGGHAILQPRVTSSLTTGKEASLFQRVFSQNRGLDPYVFTVSDVYQDLTGEGSFTGKGLYQVDAFAAVLNDKFSENSVLSHDLLEGTIGRSALVTDVELIEDFPVRYEVEVSRQHRWARGDWQLLPYILIRDSAINFLGRWKMWDNLRRSLVPVAWLLASMLGWWLLPRGIEVLWQGFLVLSLFVAPTLGLVKGVFPGQHQTLARAHFYSVYIDLVSASAQVVLRIVFIAHTAASMADAMVRSLYRTYISRRLMLEWRTAAQVHAGAYDTVRNYGRLMWIAMVIGLFGLVSTALLGDSTLSLATLFCVLWIASPIIAWWVSQSAETEDRLQVRSEDRAVLRTVARRTWNYFETFVTAEHHHLPPDNFQEIPDPVVANRTSPTNIGVYLLSVISARDFGWISMAQTVKRLQQTLTTVGQMQQYRGHLYNWYNTVTLEPLNPMYVSSVDSGNLAGHLIAVSAACRTWAEAPSAYMQTGFEGIADVTAVLREELRQVPDDRRTIRPLRRRFDEVLGGFSTTTQMILKQPEFTAVHVADLMLIAAEVLRSAQEFDLALKTEKSASVAWWARLLNDTCTAKVADLEFDLSALESLREQLGRLRDESRRIAFSMNFAFLMHPERRLLAIGFRVAEEELEDACYDLLASEARLTSLFAIAKGDLPTEHWFRLGRPIVPVGSLGALASWSGSMFEYLMPPLVIQEQRGGILNQTNALAVKRQIAYGRARNIPWGISEAAFNARDQHMTYQYSGFGVPTLGMKRDLGLDLVVAPYATLLASQYQPHAAVVNLERLRSEGVLGKYGYYDSIDYTPARLPENTKSVVVRTYMAHHHGMSIMAVANVVFEGRLRERFHSDPVIESAELLLQEKAPREVPALAVRGNADEPTLGRSEMPTLGYRTIRSPLTSPSATAVLSNGHFSLMLTATGTGYANWNDLAVTRWQRDGTEDRWGTFLFLRDAASNQWWSATERPRRAEGEVTHTVFSDSKAEFYKTVDTLDSRVDVIVSGAIDAAGWRITLTNHGSQNRVIEVTSYGEPVLALADNDAAHPLFSKMFLHTRIAEDSSVIYVRRNKREGNEPDVMVAHMVVDGNTRYRDTQAETDRRKFIGRGRTLATAAAFDAGARLSGDAGFTLDPIMSLRRTVTVHAGKQVSLIFWTVAAPTEAELELAVAELSHSERFTHEAMNAWTRSQVQLRDIGMSPNEATVFQRLARYLIYADGDLNWLVNKADLKPQSKLWSLGISGDFPIMILRIDAEADIAIVRKALRAQQYFRTRGLLADLVIVNEQATSYAQELQNSIDSLCENARLRGLARGPRDHIFALRRDLIDVTAYGTLMAAAAVTLHARNGKFSTQIDRAESLAAESPLRTALAQLKELPLPSVPAVHYAGAHAPATPEPPYSHEANSTQAKASERNAKLRFWNGYGGFDEQANEYVIGGAAGTSTPAPWINVIANAHFGFQVAAEGSGYSWSQNSRDYQLTRWSNDPVVDRPGEGFYVVDHKSRRVYSPMQKFSKTPPEDFTTRHGLSYSRFTNRSDNLILELTQTVDPEDSIKLSRLSITNSGDVPRTLRVYAYAEWVLGNSRSKTSPHIIASWNASDEILMAKNPFSLDWAERIAFLACDQPLASHTASRDEFLGKGTVLAPQAVIHLRELSGTERTNGDPCAALCCDLTLEPGASIDRLFMLGDAQSAESASALVAKHRTLDFDAIVKRHIEEWCTVLDTVQVQTPDQSLNMMINTWLPYQSISCRIRARAAFYQVSGAFGFRDQLQDSLAFLLQMPDLAHERIIAAAGRQFLEGDVQHWWLPQTGAGVRTRIADDVVWLAYGVAHYLSVTGDQQILETPIAFLEGQALEPGESDAFFQPQTSSQHASLYEHCARALDLAIERTGSHNLPLILGGDWNDGMNRVGAEGRGESVWLGWFLAHTLKRFLPIADNRGDTQRQTRWQQHLQRLVQALENAGWDGNYYRRGFYDDGTPLGSAQSLDCQIDSIAQSWSVLSEVGNTQRSHQAMDEVLDKLIDDEAQLIKLFTPAFEDGPTDPGYIRGYPPGVRENGGQYTHAATWVVCALAQLGRGDDAYRCLQMLNPINHALTQASAETYRVEPYVVAADVYSGTDRSGRGGWSWYTGSGGWLYRAAVEYVLGIRRKGVTLMVQPVLPTQWDGFSASLRIEGQTYDIRVTRDADGELLVRVNEVAIADLQAGFPLS